MDDQQIKTAVVQNLQESFERDMQRLREISAQLAEILANSEQNA